LQQSVEALDFFGEQGMRALLIRNWVLLGTELFIQKFRELFNDRMDAPLNGGILA